MKCNARRASMLMVLLALSVVAARSAVVTADPTLYGDQQYLFAGTFEHPYAATLYQYDSIFNPNVVFSATPSPYTETVEPTYTPPIFIGQEIESGTPPPVIPVPVDPVPVIPTTTPVINLDLPDTPEQPTAQAPEPATYATLGGGLLLVVFFGRRSRLK